MVKPGKTVATDKRLTEQERKQLQAEFRDYIQQYFKKVLGKGIDFTKVTICEDFLLIRLEGFLTDPEKFIARTNSGKEKVKESRMHVGKEFMADNLPFMEERLQAVTRYYSYDIDPDKDIASVLLLFGRK